MLLLLIYSFQICKEGKLNNIIVERVINLNYRNLGAPHSRWFSSHWIFFSFFFVPLHHPREQSNFLLWRWSCNFFISFIILFFILFGEREQRDELKKWYRGLIQRGYKNSSVYSTAMWVIPLRVIQRDEKWMLYGSMSPPHRSSKMRKKFSRMKWHRAVYIRQMIHILSAIWITLLFFWLFQLWERVLYDVCQRRIHKYCAVMMNNRLFRFL